MDHREEQSQMKTVEEQPKKRKHFIERVGLDLTEQTVAKFNNEERRAKLDRAFGLLMSWPTFETWPFKISVPVIAMSAAVPGYILNTAFRNVLVLGHYARTSSYFAAMGLPSVMACIAHSLVITNDIMEQKTKCPTCLQVKSASVQLAVGIIYPAVFVPITNFPTAAGIKNLYLPKIAKEPREVLKYALEIFGSVGDRYLMETALQIVAAMGVTYLQQQCYVDTLLPILTGEKTISKKNY